MAESLIVVFIFVLVVGLVYSAYAMSQRGYREGEISAELTQNARVVLERMTREIRQSREILTVLPLTAEDATGSSEIEFEDGHVGDRYYYIRYFQDGNEIKREVKRYYLAGTPVAWNAAPEEDLDVIIEEVGVTGELIDELKFWAPEPERIGISITLEKAGKQAIFSTGIFGRNL